jgi:hypothetical protein
VCWSQGPFCLWFFDAGLKLMVFTPLFQNCATRPSRRVPSRILLCYRVAAHIIGVSSSIIAGRSRGLSVEAL